MKHFFVFQCFLASTTATHEGLFALTPPSTYHPGGEGMSTLAGGKKAGAALVARAACHMGVWSLSNPYDLKSLSGPSAIRPNVATTKTGQFEFPSSARTEFSFLVASSTTFFNADSRGFSLKYALFSPTGTLRILLSSRNTLSDNSRYFLMHTSTG